MSQEPEAQTSSANAKADVPREDVPDAGRGTRIGAGVIAALILVSLVLYFVGDRLTPYTSQARVQAFVVPVAAEVSGKVTAVHIRNDDIVEPGSAAFRHRSRSNTRSRCSAPGPITSRCGGRSTQRPPAWRPRAHHCRRPRRAS